MIWTAFSPSPRPDVLILAITSQEHTTLDFASFAIRNWHAAGLLKLSFAKPVITTLEQNLIMRSMGHFSPQDCQTLRNMLSQTPGS